MNRLWASASGAALSCALILGAQGGALANDALVELAKSPENWVMTGRDYNAQNFSPSTQITKENVGELRPAWSFSTGVLHGHEGTPLVVDGKMFVHTPFPTRRLRSTSTSRARSCGRTSRARTPRPAPWPAATWSIAALPTGRATMRSTR